MTSWVRNRLREMDADTQAAIRARMDQDGPNCVVSSRGRA
jgi:hypothetical protein